MTYSSIVTSKGTITLPAGIRKRLGITKGKRVNIELHGDTISIKPQGGWEEMMQVGEEMRAYLRKKGTPVTDIEQLRAETDKIKIAEYKKKYFGK